MPWRQGDVGITPRLVREGDIRTEHFRLWCVLHNGGETALSFAHRGFVLVFHIGNWAQVCPLRPVEPLPQGAAPGETSRTCLHHGPDLPWAVGGALEVSMPGGKANFAHLETLQRMVAEDRFEMEVILTEDREERITREVRRWFRTHPVEEVKRHRRSIRASWFMRP